MKQALPDIQIAFRPNEATGRPDTYLNGLCVEQEIRGMEVADHVSQVAALGFVREALVAKQQAMGRAKGVVMDGRDIGTVVLPDATLKVYQVASVESRAKRRYLEELSKGKEASLDEIQKDIERRDYIDSHREHSPLRKAEDAILLDTSDLTIQEEIDAILSLFREKAGELK